MADQKQLALRIFYEILRAIDISTSMRRKIVRIGSRIRARSFHVDLDECRRIRVVAFGKASAAMTDTLIDLLAPEYAVEGILVAPSRPRRIPKGLRIFIAGHPVPNAESLAAARAILDLLRTSDHQTLIFFLLSGGGSALVELPLDDDITLSDIQALHRVLVTCGASIEDINAVRKHLSAVKGGRLAAAAPRALKITLGISDVPAGRESALASGPTLPDPTTVEYVCRVIEKYALVEKLPVSIRNKFERGALAETPKPGDPAFARSHFQIILGMHDLLHQAHRITEAAGFISICDNTTDDWPIDKAADFLLGQLAQLQRAYPGRPVAVIADGELSSPATGNGVGGRNAAFVLNCVEKIAGQPVVVLSAGTDGIDGSSPAAGAVADGVSLSTARAAGLDPRDYFRRSDSYNFFKTLRDAIETGPTGNNLRDLRILLAP